MFKTFQDYTDANKPKIDLWLDQYLQSASSPDIQTLVGRGGKRLRPLLCLLAYKGYGGEDEEVIMPAAGAIELMHTFLLIHDDIIDRDHRRWGGQNITGVYFEEYSRTMTAANALHYAQSQALLAGDTCQALANQTLLQTATDPDSIVKLVERYNRVLLQVLNGEAGDMTMSQSQKKPTVDQVLTMYEQKTASYSFVLPLQFGALLAGRDDQADHLAEIGNLVGVAYQIQNDIAGMFGGNSQSGQASISDLREGKRTALIVSSLSRASAKDQQVLSGLLGNNAVEFSDLKIARTIIKKSGALTHLEQIVDARSQAATELVRHTTLGREAKELLTDAITAFLDQRP